MKKLENWEGKLENTQIEYIQEQHNEEKYTNSDISGIPEPCNADFQKADKTDYIVAASCGVLTGLMDSFWVGEFSLSSAQDWGRTKANGFVVKVAQKRGYTRSELEGAIRFLEKDAPIPSDQLTVIWGGGLQHHFRDFAHHASVVGLVFSIMTQFTGLSYGTNEEGSFETHELHDYELIGKTFEEKIFNGTVIWALHLVSDMSGSSRNAGRGTGIPGPLFSLAKELSALPKIRNLRFEYKNNDISLSMLLSKIFNGTAFAHSSSKDLIRFDLRTEMGVYAFGIRQSIPVVLNQCMVRAFYFVKRFCIEASSKQVRGIRDISKLEPSHFFPRNNKCIIRMLTISSGVFCIVDASDAAIRAFIKSPHNKAEFFTQFLLRTNFVGIGNFIISIKNDIAVNLLGQKQVGKGSIVLENDIDTGLSVEAISIDIAVKIDNTGIYNYTFYRMYNHIKKTKEDFSAAQRVHVGIEREIIQLEDDETALFDRVASVCHHSLIVETEELLMRLFTLYGVEYSPFPGDAKYRYIPFYRIEDERKIGYIFTYSLMKRLEWKKMKEKYKIDGIRVVALVELGKDIETKDVIVKNEIRLSGGFVQYMPIKELFSMISEEEYDIYMTFVRKFNNDVKRLIGYRTIVVPSDSSIEELQNDIEAELRSTDFDKQLLPDGLYKSQLKII